MAGGDGVPDKYQKKVTFQVVNGTWEDGTSAAKVTYVTLMKDGKWDMNGSAYLNSPHRNEAGRWLWWHGRNAGRLGYHASCHSFRDR